MREAARRLSMPVGSLKDWLQAARAGKLKEVGKTQKPLSDLELELVRTKKELAEVKQERDLLKSALRGFVWVTFGVLYSLFIQFVMQYAWRGAGLSTGTRLRASHAGRRVPVGNPCSRHRARLETWKSIRVGKTVWLR